MVAGSSHHVLLRVSDQVGLVYGRDRLDRSVDLIEEVIRLHGYEHIPTRPPQARIAMRPAPEARLGTLALKRRWAARDYQEVINFSFVDSADNHHFRPAGDAIRGLLFSYWLWML